MSLQDYEQMMELLAKDPKFSLEIEETDRRL